MHSDRLWWSSSQPTWEDRRLSSPLPSLGTTRTVPASAESVNDELRLELLLS